MKFLRGMVFSTVPASINASVNGRRFCHNQSVVIVDHDSVGLWQGGVVFVPFDHRDGIALDIASQLDLLILLVKQLFFVDDNLKKASD